MQTLLLVLGMGFLAFGGMVCFARLRLRFCLCVRVRVGVSSFHLLFIPGCTSRHVAATSPSAHFIVAAEWLCLVLWSLGIRNVSLSRFILAFIPSGFSLARLVASWRFFSLPWKRLLRLPRSPVSLSNCVSSWITSGFHRQCKQSWRRWGTRRWTSLPSWRTHLLKCARLWDQIDVFDPASAVNRAVTARILAAWEAAGVRVRKRLEADADRKVGDLPRVLPKSFVLELVWAFGTLHFELTDRETPATTFLEKQLEQLEDGELIAATLNEVISREEEHKDPLGL
eukprot:5085816-Amphidinium_carterae.1